MCVPASRTMQHLRARIYYKIQSQFEKWRQKAPPIFKKTHTVSSLIEW